MGFKVARLERQQNARMPSRTPDRRQNARTPGKNADQNARLPRTPDPECQAPQNARPRTPDPQNAKPTTPGPPRTPGQNARGAERQNENARTPKPGLCSRERQAERKQNVCSREPCSNRSGPHGATRGTVSTKRSAPSGPGSWCFAQCK